MSFYYNPPPHLCVRGWRVRGGHVGAGGCGGGGGGQVLPAGGMHASQGTFSSFKIPSIGYIHIETNN